jgi:hypothetical protein
MHIQTDICVFEMRAADASVDVAAAFELLLDTEDGIRTLISYARMTSSSVHDVQVATRALACLSAHVAHRPEIAMALHDAQVSASNTNIH